MVPERCSRPRRRREVGAPEQLPLGDRVHEAEVGDDRAGIRPDRALVGEHHAIRQVEHPHRRPVDPSGSAGSPPTATAGTCGHAATGTGSTRLGSTSTDRARRASLPQPRPPSWWRYSGARPGARHVQHALDDDAPPHVEVPVAARVHRAGIIWPTHCRSAKTHSTRAVLTPHRRDRRAAPSPWPAPTRAGADRDPRRRGSASVAGVTPY